VPAEEKRSAKRGLAFMAFAKDHGLCGGFGAAAVALCHPVQRLHRVGITHVRSEGFAYQVSLCVPCSFNSRRLHRTGQSCDAYAELRPIGGQGI
jgi:hypothetical protein